MGTQEQISIECLLTHKDWVGRFVRQLVSDAALAEDIEQETWLAAIKHPPATKTNLRSWLARVARNSAQAMRREQARRERREAKRSSSSSSMTPAELVQRESLRREVVALVLDLDPKYRDVLLLRYCEEISVEEVARRLAVNPETVRTRIRRGRQRLQHRLDQSWGDRIKWCSAFSILTLDLKPIGAVSTSGAGLLSSFLGPIVAGGVVVGITTKVLMTLAVLGVFFGWIMMQDEDVDSIRDERGVIETTTSNSVSPRRSNLSARIPQTKANTTVASRPADNVDPEIQPRAKQAILEGYVQDEGGRPVSGATVMAGSRIQGFSFRNSIRDSFSETIRQLIASPLGKAEELDSGQPLQVRSDDAGYFRFAFDQAAELQNLVGYHERRGFGFVAGLKVRTGETTQVEIKLTAGMVIHGMVAQSDGAPISGARISIAGQDESGTASTVWRAKSGENGRFRSPTLPFPFAWLSVTKDGYFSSRNLKLDRQDGAIQERKVILKSAPTLRGRFLRRDGSPAIISQMAAEIIPKKSLSQYLSEFRSVFSASYDQPSSDPNYTSLGHCEGEINLKEGTYQITLDSGSLGYLALYMGSTCVAEVPIPEDGSSPDIILDTEKFPVPTPVCDVEIRVVDHDTGLPVESYQCQIEPQNYGINRGRRRIDEEVMNREGLFHIEKLQQDIYRLRVSAKSYAESWSRLDVQIKTGFQQVEVRLMKAVATIDGQVLDPQGKPQDGSTITLFDLGGIPALGRKSEVVTGADGVFHFGDLGESDYFISVHHNDYAYCGRVVRAQKSKHNERFLLHPGVQVKVKPKGTSGPFTFVILDGQGHTLMDGRVRGSQSWGSAWNFRLTPDLHTLIILCPNMLADPLNFRAEEDLILEPVFRQAK